MSWIIKIIAASAVFFLTVWSLLLTAAQRSLTFPESLYSISIVGPAAAFIGEGMITAIIAALPTYIFFRLIVLISTNPRIVTQFFESVLDISTGVIPGASISIDYSSRKENINGKVDHWMHLDSEQMEQLERKVVSAITEKNGLALIATIENRFGKKAIEEAQSIALQDSIAKVHEELTEERRVVSSRSGINLVIGILFAATGIAILVYTFFSVGSATDEDVVAIAFRVSLAVSVQIFAYFFLSLYRAGLSDVKFFRNEITNIGLARVGLLLSLQRGSSEDISDIARKFVATERNFILRKGETTAASEASADAANDRAVGLVEKGVDIARKVIAEKPS